MIRGLFVWRWMWAWVEINARWGHLNHVPFKPSFSSLRSARHKPTAHPRPALPLKSPILSPLQTFPPHFQTGTSFGVRTALRTGRSPNPKPRLLRLLLGEALLLGEDPVHGLGARAPGRSGRERALSSGVSARPKAPLLPSFVRNRHGLAYPTLSIRNLQDWDPCLSRLILYPTNIM